MHVRIYKIVGIVLSAMLLLASCAHSDLEKKKIKIAYANWLEGIAMSHLAKVVLEEHGYEVELQNADLAPIFVSMARKKSDVFLDAWLPITMKDYMDQYGDSIEFLGEVYEEARIGLVVPEYVTIQSISELADHKDRFSSEIVGIDAGAGIMKTTDKAITAYGLDGYTLMTSSSSTMLASLKKAMDKGEWVVITGWTPHWMFDQFDLKFLDDPKKVYGDLEEIHAIAWKGFSEKDPFAAEFFGNIKLTTEELRHGLPDSAGVSVFAGRRGFRAGDYPLCYADDADAAVPAFWGDVPQRHAARLRTERPQVSQGTPWAADKALAERSDVRAASGDLRGRADCSHRRVRRAVYDRVVQQPDGCAEHVCTDAPEVAAGGDGGICGTDAGDESHAFAAAGDFPARREGLQIHDKHR